MKTKFYAFLLLLTLSGGAHAASLSDTAQAAVLSKKIIAAYTAEDYAAAQEMFIKYDQLDAAMPPPLMLVRVRVHYHLDEFLVAYQLLGDYLNTAPSDSPDYDTAVEMYVALEAKPGLAAAKAVAIAKFAPKMVTIPPGSFMMGSRASEERRGDDEGPRHQVRIDYPFAVSVYEITHADWGHCVANGGCNGYQPDDEGWGRSKHPVINVSWKDAQSYVSWLSDKTGEDYRLLSESEWEYAARAGTTTPFHYGETISTNQANYNGDYTYGSGSKGAYRERTVTVGSFPPNDFDLHDVHGNVSEWVQDCWNENYAGAPNDGSAWESGDCVRRVLRGGSWGKDPRYLRSAGRIGNNTEVRSSNVGFRVARTLTP